MAKRYGLLGEKLGHSHSPRIHNLFADYSYELFEVLPEGLKDLLSRNDLGGLNVTIPYKKAVVPYCDSLSDAAKAIGSVNTLVFRDGKLHGHNTDYGGFLYMARRAGIVFSGKKVVVLGSGGASLAVIQAAKDQGAREVVVISRKGPDNYDNLEKHADADVLVNATPVGMFPKCEGLPVDLSRFPGLTGVLDLVYNPLRTNLILQAGDLPHAGGLSMLVAQARESSECFTGRQISDARMEEVLDILRRDVENLVLVGMPGCGKSVIGQKLAQAMGRPFVDTDQLITDEAGISIPEIFAQEGETGFRARETRAILQAASKTGCVISTGGGAVLAEENRRALKRSGRVLLLQRELSLLAKKGRPLSTDLAAMYERRLPFYLAAADVCIDNNGPLSETLEKALRAFENAIG